MRKRINFDIFKKNQIKAQSKHNPLQHLLYQTSYQLVDDLVKDIKKPFNNICIHGYYPQLIINHLIKHRIQLTNRSIINKTNQLPIIKVIDYLDILEERNIKNDHFQTTIIKVENSDYFPPEDEQFDLIISGLELNHTNSQEKLLEKYLRTLKSDGALIGCAVAEGTLSELHWAYLMAENQRYGGLSPKIMNFLSLGHLGNILTSTHYHLTTVLNRDYELQFDSPLDLLKAIEFIGQSGHLRGRRKGVYKDLLISMYALYQQQFTAQNKLQQTQELRQQRILSSLVLAPFVGWKYSKDQPKPLRRGQHGQSIDFIDQLRKFDPDLQHYRINQEDNQLQQVKKK